ncbi:lipopolysaccharide biosynthesis protein [Paenibacillus sp. CCS19]|uniref:lipopolysaccharide biosynthesis protein n=1 Tax=Paenibacillus sp. CCS19 TaxID=3158387 RepID=UPI00256B329A|nr:lipopolysaccharide biosynthesis protein [Paenibacillus cellulosilyticus]GMK41164.1 lipopolysaccharide biosynthesis protein [Paenibacillus cellulosilyticus]
MKEKELSIKSAAMINVIARYSNIVIQIVANALLARLLSAEDYGIMAIVQVFIGFFILLSDMGIGAGIIQNKTLTSEDNNSIFSLTVYIGFILMILFLLLSFPIAWFYNNDVFVPIVSLLSLTVLFATVNIVPNALLMKRKRFKLVGIRTVAISGLSLLVCISLAYFGLAYYALVAQSLFMSIVTFMFNISSTRLKFIANFKLNAINKIFGFSAYDFGFNMINYFARNMDSILTGKFISSAALGFYSRAYNLMLYPVINLTHVITPILHPILSEHQDNKEYIYEKYIKIYKLLSLLGVFVSVVCYFAASELINIIYGPKWNEVVPCMAALGVSIWFQMTASSCGSIYRSLGSTNIMFRSVMLYVPIQLVMIIVGVWSQNIVTLSWSVSMSFVIKFFIEYFYLIGKAFKKSVIRFLILNVPEIIIALLMIGAMILFRNMQWNNIYLSFLNKFLICFTMYLIGMLVTRQLKYFNILIPAKFRVKSFGFRMKRKATDIN